MGVKRVVSKILPPALKQLLVRLRSRILDTHATKSYSQEGEDLLLWRIFNGRERGFYVDVGAHHPRRFSNTYSFYRHGWTGINIEPSPDAIRAFARERKRDTNLQMGVAERAQTLAYYVFDEPALNTFDQGLMEWRLANTPYRVLRTIPVPVERLDAILGRYLPAGRRIDFLTVDVEGLDFAVLRSNDWRQFRPQCVLVEALDTSLEDVMRGALYQFVEGHGYELFAKTFNTLMFRDIATRGTSRDQNQAAP
jgi:FkbM family methyltransferase